MYTHQATHLAGVAYCSSWHCKSKDTHVHARAHTPEHSPLSHMNCKVQSSRWGLSFCFVVTIWLHGAKILTSSWRFITSQIVWQGDLGRPTQWPTLKGNPYDKSRGNNKYKAASSFLRDWACVATACSWPALNARLHLPMSSKSSDLSMTFNSCRTLWPR